MVRPVKRKARRRHTAPPATRPGQAAAAQPERLRRASSEGAGGRLDGGEVMMVRRSRVAPCVTCGLCGGILRDATTVSECLHSFCRKCIFQKLEDEDIKCCPTCTIDLGCAPLEKLRVDHSLLRIGLMVFPAKRRRVDEISPLDPSLVSPPPSHPVLEGYPSAKKTAVATGVRSASVASSTDTEKGQGGAQKECAQLAERGQSVGELQGATQGHGTENHTPVSKLAIQFEESKCKSHVLAVNQAMPQERSTPAEEVGLLIVTVERERTEVAAEFTVSSAVEIAAAESAALPPVASQSETHENTTRISETFEVYMGRRQALEAENARLREELEIEKVEKAAAFERARILEERLERDSDVAQNTARMLEMVQDYRGRSQALGITNARLRKELEKEKANKFAAFEKIRVLEEKLRTQSERLQTQSEIAEKAETAQRQLLKDYLALESEIDAWKLLFWDYQNLKSDFLAKSEEHATLLYNIDNLEKEKTCLEYQVDRLAKSLAQRSARIFERLEAYVGRYQDSRAKNARLREELDNEKAKQAAALERARTLEEMLRRESDLAQRTEGALRQFLMDHHALDLALSEEKE